MSNKRIGTREILARILLAETIGIGAFFAINHLFPDAIPPTITLLQSLGTALALGFHSLEANTQHMLKAFVSFLLAVGILMPEYFHRRHRHLAKRALNRRYERRSRHNHSLGLWQHVRGMIVTLLVLNAVVEIAPALQALGLALGALLWVLRKVVANIFASLIFLMSPDRDERLEPGEIVVFELRTASGFFSSTTRVIEGTIDRVSLTKVHITSAVNVETQEYEGRLRIGSWDIYDGMVYYVTEVEPSEDEEQPKSGRRKTDKKEPGFKATLVHLWNLLNNSLLTEWELEELHEKAAKAEERATERPTKERRKTARTVKRPATTAPAKEAAEEEMLFGSCAAPAASRGISPALESCTLSTTSAADASDGNFDESIDAGTEHVEESLAGSAQPFAATCKTSPAAQPAAALQESQLPPASSSKEKMSFESVDIEACIDAKLPKSEAKSDRCKQLEALKMCREGICTSSASQSERKASERVNQSIGKTSEETGNGKEKAEEAELAEEAETDLVIDANEEDDADEDEEFFGMEGILGGADEKGNSKL
jgi:hypothetical protein